MVKSSNYLDKVFDLLEMPIQEEDIVVKKSVKVASKARSKKSSVVVKLETVVNENVQNSLSTFKERISKFTMEEQVKLLKDWELKRKDRKKVEESDKEAKRVMEEDIKKVVTESFVTMLKYKGKYNTIIIKSPLDRKSYKFIWKLSKYN